MTDQPTEPTALDPVNTPEEDHGRGPIFTTAEKIEQMIGYVETIKPGEAAPEMRSFVTGLQIASGMGFNLLAVLRPENPEDADLMVDQGIRLLLMLRGDDLPPFDLTNYGELSATPSELGQ